MENPPFWWYLPGKVGIFMGHVSFREGTRSDADTLNGPMLPLNPFLQLWGGVKLSLVTGGPGTSESTVSLVLFGFKELKMMVQRSNSPS